MSTLGSKMVTAFTKSRKAAPRRFIEDTRKCASAVLGDKWRQDCKSCRSKRRVICQIKQIGEASRPLLDNEHARVKQAFGVPASLEGTHYIQRLRLVAPKLGFIQHGGVSPDNNRIAAQLFGGPAKP